MKHNSDRKKGKNRAENCCIGKEGSESQKPRFYQQSWFILLSLFFFAPVGIFLLYRFGKWNKFLKAAAALFSLVWFLFVVFAEYPPAASETLSPDTDSRYIENQTEKDVQEYSLSESYTSFEEETEKDASEASYSSETSEPTASKAENSSEALPSSEKSTLPQTQPSPIGTEYVLNTNTKVYHRPSCRYTKTIKAENCLLSSTVPSGYRPCKVCKP